MQLLLCEMAKLDAGASVQNSADPWLEQVVVRRVLYSIDLSALRHWVTFRNLLGLHRIPMGSEDRLPIPGAQEAGELTSKAESHLSHRVALALIAPHTSVIGCWRRRKRRSMN